MNKQNHTGLAKIVKITPAKEWRLFSLTLKIGDWKKLFPEPRFKWMIAEALNEWMEMAGPANEEFNRTSFYLIGYLITDRRLCLVLKIRKNNIDDELHRLCNLMRMIIIKNLKEANLGLDSLFSSQEQEQEHDDETNLNHDLFNKRTGINHFLVKLITGRQVKLPYYNSHLARLEDSIHNYNFCSAMDYSGAKGPVNVIMLSPDEFIELEKRK